MSLYQKSLNITGYEKHLLSMLSSLIDLKKKILKSLIYNKSSRELIDAIVDFEILLNGLIEILDQDELHTTRLKKIKELSMELNKMNNDVIHSKSEDYNRELSDYISNFHIEEDSILPITRKLHLLDLCKQLMRQRRD